MKKAKSFILYTSSVLILRGLDLLCTYIYMPELDAEYNPLVSLLGASWGGLLLAQLLLVLLISGCAYLYATLKPPQVSMKNLTLSDFIYVFFFGELHPWRKRFFSRPKDFKTHLYFNGFLIPSVAILVSIFAIINNLLLILNIAPYREFLNRWFDLFFPLVFLTIIVISALLFFHLQYHTYKKQQRVSSDKEHY